MLLVRLLVNSRLLAVKFLGSQNYTWNNPYPPCCLRANSSRKCTSLKKCMVSRKPPLSCACRNPLSSTHCYWFIACIPRYICIYVDKTMTLVFFTKQYTFGHCSLWHHKVLTYYLLTFLMSACYSIHILFNQMDV